VLRSSVGNISPLHSGGCACAELVAPPAADQGADAGADRVRAERADQADEIRAEVEQLGPQREAGRTGDDRSRVASLSRSDMCLS